MFYPPPFIPIRNTLMRIVRTETKPNNQMVKGAAAALGAVLIIGVAGIVTLALRKA